MRGLDIPFEERLVPFIPGSNWEAFRSFSPSGTVPALITDQGSVWDSLAIIEFLAEQYKSVWPVDQEARTWSRCAAAEMHSGFAALRDVCSMSCGVRIKLREINPALQKNIARIAMKSWYEQALQEVWRDAPHDEMCLELGDVVEDYRA